MLLNPVVRKAPCGQTTNIFGYPFYTDVYTCSGFHRKPAEEVSCVNTLACLHHTDARLEQVEQLPEGYY